MRSDLQLLQLPDVGVTLQLQVSHLVLVFLVLMQTLVLLPPLLLSCELRAEEGLLLFRLCILTPPNPPPHLLDPLPLLLGGDAGGGDAEALLEHGHARLGLAALDLGQPRSLLRLLVLQLLNESLVVALHLLHLLNTHTAATTTPSPTQTQHRQLLKSVQTEPKLQLVKRPTSSLSLIILFLLLFLSTTKDYK